MSPRTARILVAAAALTLTALALWAALHSPTDGNWGAMPPGTFRP